MNESLLGPVISTTIIPATKTKFIVREKFVVNDRNAGVVIECLGGKFKKWFIDKEENPFTGGTVYGRDLVKKALDTPILEELGGEKKAKTTLCEIYTMLEKQSDNREEGLLLGNEANIFFVEDVNNVLRAVGVGWHKDQLIVDAYLVDDSNPWFAVHRFFSNHSLKS